MKVLPISSKEFQPYGRIVDDVDFSELLTALEQTPITQQVVYVPSAEGLENTGTFQQLSTITFGQMPIQIGYCNGHNSKLNALEYHKNSEVNVMATDAILLLALRTELKEDFTYDTSKVKAFFVPAGTAVEIYATTLHYAPCGVAGAGFQVAIVLPKGTNYPISGNQSNVGEARLMTAVNKWLIGHPEGGLDEGAFLGLTGENLSVV